MSASGADTALGSRAIRSRPQGPLRATRDAQAQVVMWPRIRPVSHTARARAPSRYCYLLDEDADLAAAFDLRMRLVVRQVATCRVVDVRAGEWWVDEQTDSGLGGLVLDGVIMVDVHFGERITTELLGPGDLLLPCAPEPDQLIGREMGRRALVGSRVALLNAEFLDRTRPWPEIVLTLLRRSERRAEHLNLQRAASSHPSLEMRLTLLLWYLAERWGRVEQCGIRLDLPLTHALLGRLVSAERPSVSRSLGRLAEQGLITGGAGGWHLAGSAEECIRALH